MKPCPYCGSDDCDTTANDISPACMERMKIKPIMGGGSGGESPHGVQYNADLETRLSIILTDPDYEGGVQFWIRKHDELAIRMAESLGREARWKACAEKLADPWKSHRDALAEFDRLKQVDP